jgi:hypothetical protein
MTTLRYNEEIFTANYIEHISKINSIIPRGNFNYTIQENVVDAKIAQAHKIPIPSTYFTITLVSGKEITKRFYYKDLSDDVKEQVVDAAKKIEDECGYTKLQEIRDKKNEIIREQKYEEAVDLRDQERDAIEVVESNGYHLRIAKEVIEDIIIRKLTAIAEDSRSWIESIVNAEKLPIRI